MTDPTNTPPAPSPHDEPIPEQTGRPEPGAEPAASGGVQPKAVDRVPWMAEPRVAAVVSGAAYGALLVFGLGLGLYESFSFSWSVGSFPLAAVLISVLNLGIFWAAGWGMGGKLGAVIPAAAWLVMVMFFSAKTPQGSLVVTGTAAGNVFLLGGTLGAILAILFTRSSGNWLLGGGMGGARQSGG